MSTLKLPSSVHNIIIKLVLLSELHRLSIMLFDPSQGREEYLRLLTEEGFTLDDLKHKVKLVEVSVH